MKPTESRDRMLAFVDETVDALGSTGWREGSGATIQGCAAGSDDGFNYSYIRLGPPTADPEHDVEVVEQFWVSRGYRTKLVKPSNPADESILLFAAGDAVRTIRFSAEPKGTAFSVESACIPGDIGAIIDSGDF